MAKQLLIMRHAKSSWANGELTDHQRPLNPRGLRDAPRMGQFLSEMKCIPDLVISSTAVRAHTTANLVVEACDEIECSVLATKDFYQAPANTYLRYAEGLGDDVGTALFVGHNPGMEDLVELLSGDYEPMPTAALAQFVFKIESWSELKVDNVEMLNLWRPKEI